MTKFKYNIIAICLICLSSIFLSCKDDFDIDKLNAKSKIVVYCFPSTADTTLISVTKSIPVRKKTKQTTIPTIDNANISYKVNGEKRNVTPKGNGQYYVVGKQKEGDKIEIEVYAEGMPSASASTVIPKACKIDDFQKKKVTEYSTSNLCTETYQQIRPTFTDNAKRKDYYAVRVAMRSYKAQEYDESDTHVKEWVVTDSVMTYPEVYTDDEDLLKPLSEIDEDFGFDNNFYQRFYIFDDNTINGSQYTMRLNIPEYESVEYYDFMKKYSVELYKLSPEYYHFIKSLNDVANNGMAEVGLSQITPTYTNIKGGLGLLGAFNKTESIWL